MSEEDNSRKLEAETRSDVVGQIITRSEGRPLACSRFDNIFLSVTEDEAPLLFEVRRLVRSPVRSLTTSLSMTEDELDDRG